MKIRKRRIGARIVLLSATSLFSGLASVWAPKVATEVVRRKPSVELLASKTVLTYPCAPGWNSQSRTCPTDADLQVILTAAPKGFQQQSTYTYTVNGGRILGEGAKVTWDLSDARPGYYVAVLEVQDQRKHRATASVNVTLGNCPDCVSEEPCAPMVVQCYDEVKAGTAITCKVIVGPVIWRGRPGFEWSTQDWNGEDLTERISGQGRSISIRTDGLGGRHLKTKVNVRGLDPSCSTTAEASTNVKP